MLKSFWEKEKILLPADKHTLKGIYKNRYLWKCISNFESKKRSKYSHVGNVVGLLCLWNLQLCAIFWNVFLRKKMVLRQSESSGRLGGTLEVSNLRKLLVKNKLQGAHSTFQRGQPTRKDRLRQRLQDGLANHRSWLKLKLIRQRSLSSTIVFIIIILFASLASAIPFDGHSMRISKRLARNEGSGYIGRSFPLQWNFVLWNTFSEKLYKEKSVLFSETFFQTRFDEVLSQNISMIY